jgi:hypothetical protein
LKLRSMSSFNFEILKNIDKISTLPDRAQIEYFYNC